MLEENPDINQYKVYHVKYIWNISPDIFQASSFQLLKLENLLRWSLFTFKVYHFTYGVQGNGFSSLDASFSWYILHLVA